MTNKVKISEPTTKQDFVDAHRLIEENIVKHSIKLDELKNTPLGNLLIAKIDNKVVGVSWSYSPGKVFEEFEGKIISVDEIDCNKDVIGYISIIAVDKKYQKQGIGRDLLLKAINHQKQKGAKCVVVHAWSASPKNAAEKMLENLGFEKIKLHEKVMHDYSKKVGKDGFWCQSCGNPCNCDVLEMVKYILSRNI